MPADDDLLDEAYEGWDAEDPDAPQEGDLDDEDGETPTVPCPACRRPVPDFAERCPYCGDWIVPGVGDAPRRKPWFLIALVLAVALVFAWLIL